jgi:hypothetical protein
VIIAPSQDNLQKGIYTRKLSIYTNYNMMISTDETKVTGFKGKIPIRIKIVVNE